jgi:hypothetical protein
MGNARKQMFFGHQRYPTITCPMCNSNKPDTWLHVLLTCKHQHIHSLRVKRHNKAVGEIRKLLISSEKSRCFTLMNVGTFNNNPQENTIPNWLLPCTCGTQDVTATQDFDLISFVLRDYHIKMTLPVTLTLTTQYNLLNSHTAMIDFL